MITIKDICKICEIEQLPSKILTLRSLTDKWKDKILVQSNRMYKKLSKPNKNQKKKKVYPRQSNCMLNKKMKSRQLKLNRKLQLKHKNLCRNKTWKKYPQLTLNQKLHSKLMTMKRKYRHNLQ